jgi:hypothetical protein
VGLIARHLEAAGIPTLCLSSALSITRAVNPPRAVYLDFPLGHTAGRPHDRELQRAILRDALRAFETLDEPGQVSMLPYSWGEDEAWKHAALGAPRGSDERRERDPSPQYQCEDDRRRAEAAVASGGCAGCVWLEPPVAPRAPAAGPDARGAS